MDTIFRAGALALAIGAAALLSTTDALADTSAPLDARHVCEATQPATNAPLTREQVVAAMREEKANGCWELSQFHYPAPYDAPLRAHVLAMQQERAKNTTAQ
jgi:hypothetical protein